MLKLKGILLIVAMSALAAADALADGPTDGERVRSITVGGSGYAEAAPDRAIVSMSIVARASAVPDAQKEAAEVGGKVLALTRRLGIDRDRVDTTGASVRPDYRWNRETNDQELAGYIAERRVTVRLDDLEKLGALIEGAVEAGVNQVAPPVLDSSERKAAHRDALRAAAEDARANAEALAATLGVRLGGPISIVSGTDRPAFPLSQRGFAIAAAPATAEAAETYNAADLRFDARVTVVFEIAE